jgi:hypothetical protein
MGKQATVSAQCASYFVAGNVASVFVVRLKTPGKLQVFGYSELTNAAYFHCF